MTASTLTQLPLMAGGALLGSMSRAGSWAFSRYMRAPLASTGLLAMVTMTALAGSNALYFQTTEHPAPLFAPERSIPEPAAAPVPAPAPVRAAEPAPKQTVSLPAIPAAPAETTGSVSSAPEAIPTGPVGNAEMFALQKRLSELGLFQGKVDGYYGPKTADAIRAFEIRNNMTPTGALDPDVISVILGNAQPAPAPGPQAAVSVPAHQPVAAVQPQPVPTVRATTAPQQIVPVAQTQNLSPAEQAFDEVAIATATTIDGIIAAMDGARTPAAQASNPPVPKATLPASQPVQTMPESVETVATTAPVASPVSVPPATDTELVAQIQRGLASLGFFRAQVDGKPGPETARAIREFENFHRYKITGLVKPDLVELLRNEGASI